MRSFEFATTYLQATGSLGPKVGADIRNITRCDYLARVILRVNRSKVVLEIEDSLELLNLENRNPSFVIEITKKTPIFMRLKFSALKLIAITIIALFVLTTSRATSTAPAEATFSCDTPNLSLATYPLNNTPNDIEAGDLNGDNKPELVVHSVFLPNTGNGRFGAQIGLPTTVGASWKLLGDFNGDGKLDVFVASALLAGIRMQVLFGVGNGTFAATPQNEVFVEPRAMSVSDFNGDNKSDLAMLFSGSPVYKVVIWTSDGAGGFIVGAENFVGMGAGDLEVGDFNQDGKRDLAVLNRTSEDVSVLLGVGDGTFSPANSFLAGPVPWELNGGDFNGDSRLDLAIMSSSSRRVTVILGNGTGGFSSPIYNTYTGLMNSMATGDFNGDGKSDVAVVGNQSTEVLILLAIGGGSFTSTPVSYNVGEAPKTIIAGDFNADGRKDLAVGNSSQTANYDYSIQVLIGKGDGEFVGPRNFPVGGYAFALEKGDFNEDGQSDLVVTSQSSSTTTILLGTGTGHFGAPIVIQAGLYRGRVVVGDFNGDNNLDFIVYAYDYPSIVFFPGTGTGTFGPFTLLNVGSSPNFMAVADFNNDGKLDLTKTSYGTDGVSILLGVGNGTFNAPTTYNTDLGPSSVSIKDFNGDSKFDLAVANSGYRFVSVLLGIGDGTFGPATNYTVGSQPIEINAGDINHDGKIDLVMGNAGTNDFSFLPGNGNGTFGPFTTFGSHTGIYSMVMDDLNGDNMLDIVVSQGSNSSGEVSKLSIFSGNLTGGFNNPVIFPLGRVLRALVMDDFNRDGKQDVAATNYSELFNGPTVTVMLNTSCLVLRSAPFDFDGDGKSDIAVYRAGVAPSAPSYWHVCRVLMARTSVFSSEQAKTALCPLTLTAMAKLILRCGGLRPASGIHRWIRP